MLVSGFKDCYKNVTRVPLAQWEVPRDTPPCTIRIPHQVPVTQAEHLSSNLSLKGLSREHVGP